MAFTKSRKMKLRTHVLSEEAEDWWDNTRQRLEVVGVEIIWAVFMAEFLQKYFLEDVCIKKEMEFLELKQGNTKIVEYATKFDKLEKFFPHYNVTAAEGPKYIKFESELHPKIKQGIRYHEML